MRCRALLARGEEAVELFTRALAAHARGTYGGVGNVCERSHTQLLYGMALRRQRRPSDARDVLHDALVGFERCAAGAWADRTRAEPRATGAPAEPGPSGALPALSRLTPQQLRIARHVAEDATNREVATWLAVSPRAVDHHLRNVFSALGIRSRADLTRLLAAARTDGTTRQLG